MNQLKNYPKPCPYCGGESFIAFSKVNNAPYITSFHSKKCLMRPDTWLIATESLNTQLKAWNMRAGDKDA